MSFFNTWLLLTSALVAPQGSMINKNPCWISSNPQQKAYLQKHRYYKQDLRNFSPDELQGWASTDNEFLNAIAHQNNIPVYFNPFGEHGFGTLSILDIALFWKHKPRLTDIEFIENENPYVFPIKALSFTRGFKVLSCAGYEHPIVKINTISGDSVYLTIADEKLESFKLSKKIRRLRDNLRSNRKKPYHEVIVPEIAYEGSVDISWLQELVCEGKHENETYAINQAVEYIKVHCNQDGCAIKAGIGVDFMPISTMYEKRTLSINKPFYFWIERAHCATPVVEAYIEHDSLVAH